MYKIFAKNLNNYFILNEAGSPQEFRLKIAQVLRGIADRSLYEEWSITDKEKFEEVNNLVYEINNAAQKYHVFETFSRDLWIYEYKAQKSNKFPKEVVEEQLKLVKLLLGTQYWVEIK